MTRSWWKWTWIFPAGVVVVCAALEVTALADRSGGEPRNGDMRRYVLGEIFDAHRVEERFVVRANGFSAITIHPRPVSSSPSGTVILELRDVTEGRAGGVVKRLTTSLASLAQSEAFTMRFPPQPSRYREYVLEVMVDGGGAGHGIGFLASRGEGYRGATLHIDGGRARFGDLIFETTVAGATSNFQSISSHLARGGVPAPRLVLILLLLLKNAALFVVIRVLAQPAVPATLPPRTAPLPQARQ